MMACHASILKKCKDTKNPLKKFIEQVTSIMKFLFLGMYTIFTFTDMFIIFTVNMILIFLGIYPIFT